ncbi:MAG: hypothetical protein JRN06_09485 [Nitrososphaerota archaeon]|nr:hypothetical protein [Nitrososphaerota archaeon]MDG7024817.1 hypothetical protein [Nitrososphaerota archaeon]
MKRTTELEPSPRVPGPILLAEGVPIEVAGSGREVADKIRDGRALLKIVAAPWGADFYVVEVGKER